MQIMKKNEVEFIPAESSVCLLFYPSGSVSDNVRWCPRLALGSMFKATSNPQSVAVSFRFGCVHCSGLLVFINTRFKGGSHNI